MLANYAGLLGVAESSPLRWGIPASYLLVAVTGFGYGLGLKVLRPEVYARIGRGARAVLPPPGPVVHATGGSSPWPYGQLQANGPVASDPFPAYEMPGVSGAPVVLPGEDTWAGSGWSDPRGKIR